MQPWQPDTSYGTLTINSLSMHTYAWLVRDVRPLYTRHTVRGRNVIIPGASGTRPYRYRTTEFRHVFKMWFTGECDSAGNAHADRFTGLQTNLETFSDAVLEPPVSGVLAASLVMPDASVRTADIQVIDFELDDVDQARNAVVMFDARLEILIPAGRFS